VIGLPVALMREAGLILVPYVAVVALGRHAEHDLLSRRRMWATSLQSGSGHSVAASVSLLVSGIPRWSMSPGVLWLAPTALRLRH